MESLDKRYFAVKLNVSKNQHDKIKRAAQDGNKVSIQFGSEDFEGDHVLALTKGQINAIAAAVKEKKGVRITLSKTQVKYNKSVEGGFLLLLGMIASAVLPTVVGKIADYVTGNSGKGLNVKTGSGIAKITVVGDGLYLKPYNGAYQATGGDGLYIKKGGELVPSGVGISDIFGTILDLFKAGAPTLKSMEGNAITGLLKYLFQR